MSEEPTPLHEEPWNAWHVHSEWDAGGFCNSLVLDEPDGCGTSCGYQVPEMKAIMERQKELEDKFSRVSTRVLYSDIDRALVVLSEQMDDGPCALDHHGGCQAHAYLDLDPGQICGNLEARRLLIKYGYWKDKN